MLLREQYRAEKNSVSPQGQSGNKSLLLPRAPRKQRRTANHDPPFTTGRIRVRTGSTTCPFHLQGYPNPAGDGSSLDTSSPPPTHTASFSSFSSCFSSLSLPSVARRIDTYLKYPTYLSALRLDDTRGVAGHRLRGSRATATGQS